jgi:hypothetical protein
VLLLDPTILGRQTIQRRKKEKPEDPLITAQTIAYQLRLINESEDAIRRFIYPPIPLVALFLLRS